MKILVSSNCQTGGLAASLRAILPEVQIIPMELPSGDGIDKTNELISLLRRFDIWISGGRFELADGVPIQKIIKAPPISFNAFHPDLIYARKKSTNELTKVRYNSRIAVWAYSNSILPVDAVKLFNYQSYLSLGYFNYWNRSVKTLQKRFEKFDYSVEECNDFISRLKRCGLFMHSINHPHSMVLVQLAKLIASRLDVSPSLINREILISDGLTRTIWPVYPEIGDELAIEGSYVWRINNVEIEGIKKYLEFSYLSYEQQGILPDDIIAATPLEGVGVDAILRAQL